MEEDPEYYGQPERQEAQKPALEIIGHIQDEIGDDCPSCFKTFEIIEHTRNEIPTLFTGGLKLPSAMTCHARFLGIDRDIAELREIKNRETLSPKKKRRQAHKIIKRIREKINNVRYHSLVIIKLIKDALKFCQRNGIPLDQFLEQTPDDKKTADLIIEHRKHLPDHVRDFVDERLNKLTASINRNKSFAQEYDGRPKELVRNFFKLGEGAKIRDAEADFSNPFAPIFTVDAKTFTAISLQFENTTIGIYKPNLGAIVIKKPAKKRTAIHEIQHAEFDLMNPYDNRETASCRDLRFITDAEKPSLELSRKIEKRLKIEMQKALENAKNEVLANLAERTPKSRTKETLKGAHYDYTREARKNMLNDVKNNLNLPRKFKKLIGNIIADLKSRYDEIIDNMVDLAYEAKDINDLTITPLRDWYQIARRCPRIGKMRNGKGFSAMDFSMGVRIE